MFVVQTVAYHDICLTVGCTTVLACQGSLFSAAVFLAFLILVLFYHWVVFIALF